MDTSTKERLWFPWLATQKPDWTAELPFFAKANPGVLRDRIPFDQLRPTAFVVKRDGHFVGYKLMQGGGENWAWRYAWQEGVRRHMARPALILTEVNPIGLHSVFGHAPKTEDDMLRHRIVAERCAVREAPPPDDALYWEVNWEWSYTAPAFAAWQVEASIAGPRRVQRCVDGAREKLADGNLWHIAEAIGSDDPKGVGVWLLTGAPYIDDTMAFQDPDKFAAIRSTSRRFRETLAVLHLHRFEAFTPIPRRWTIQEHIDYIARVKRLLGL